MTSMENVLISKPKDTPFSCLSISTLDEVDHNYTVSHLNNVISAKTQFRRHTAPLATIEQRSHELSRPQLQELTLQNATNPPPLFLLSNQHISNNPVGEEATGFGEVDAVVVKREQASVLVVPQRPLGTRAKQRTRNPFAQAQPQHHFFHVPVVGA